MEWIVSLLTFVTGILGTFIFYHSKQRQEAAKAAKAESEAIKSFATEWKEIAEVRETNLAVKDKKIDELYGVITQWREKHEELLIKYNALVLDKQSADYRICNRRGCQQREPQTGF